MSVIQILAGLSYIDCILHVAIPEQLVVFYCWNRSSLQLNVFLENVTKHFPY